MGDQHAPLASQGLLAFPPRSHHLLLPNRSRAARAALALYDATLPHQRFAALMGESLLRAGLGSLLRVDDLPAVIDEEWWSRWCREVGAKLIGDVHYIGFRIWEDRVAGLLLDREGAPLGFVKKWRQPPDADRSQRDLQARILACLASAGPPTTFRTPALLSQGSLDGWTYLLFEALPAGRHRRMPPDPARLHRIVDEAQGLLGSFERPDAVPAHHVMSHGDLTPRNLRIAADGSAWLFDWEYACWAPPLADELRFWVTDAALRRRPRPERDGRRIAAVLARRGSRGDIAEALQCEDYITPAEAAIRGVIARETGIDRG